MLTLFLALYTDDKNDICHNPVVMIFADGESLVFPTGFDFMVHFAGYLALEPGIMTGQWWAWFDNMPTVKFNQGKGSHKYVVNCLASVLWYAMLK